MKRITSIALIFLLSLQCIYQLGVIAYFQVNQDYIARVLCINKEMPASRCHGQCFLENKLDVATDRGSDGKTLPVNNQKVDLSVFLITEAYRSSEDVECAQENNSRYLTSTSSTHHPAPFRPPACTTDHI